MKIENKRGFSALNEEERKKDYSMLDREKKQTIHLIIFRGILETVAKDTNL